MKIDQSSYFKVWRLTLSYIHHAGKIGESLPIPESPKAMREEGEILQSCPNDEYKINIPT